MDKFEYRPATFGAGTVKMDGPAGFVGTAENVRSRTWARELGKRDLLSAARVARECDVDFACDFETADALREAADADLLALTPGTFVAQGEWKQRGYIVESNVKGVHFGWLNTSLVIALLDGAWWRVQSRSYLPESSDPGVKHYQSDTGKSVRTYGAAEEPLHALTIYGEARQIGTPTPSSPIPVQVVEAPNMIVVPDKSGSANNSYFIAFVTSNGTITNVDPVEAGVTYTLSADVQSSVEPFNFSVGLGNGTYAVDVSTIYGLSSGRVSVTFTPTATQIENYGNVIAIRAPRYNPADSFTYSVSNVQLEIGSTATPYVPKGYIGLNCGGIQTLIDMNGNFLASLPDGTRDELSIDSAGAVTITKRVGVVTLTSSNITDAISYPNQVLTKAYGTNNNYLQNANRGADNSGLFYMSDYFVTSSSYSDFREGDAAKVSVINAGRQPSFRITATIAPTLSDAQTWLTTHPVTLYYKLREEQTITLDPITMPDTADGGTVEVIAAITPTITAEWEMAQHINLDYPYNYSYDYSQPTTGASVNTERIVPCKPFIVFYGAVTDPEITIAGNKYKVTKSVPAGARIEIDGRDKTVKMITSDGTTTDEFANALRGSGEGGGEYIFQPIPPGEHSITWNGTFGIDVGWYDEVGEPPWNLY